MQDGAAAIERHETGHVLSEVDAFRAFLGLGRCLLHVSNEPRFGYDGQRVGEASNPGLENEQLMLP